MSYYKTKQILYNEQFSLLNKKGDKSWPADDIDQGLVKQTFTQSFLKNYVTEANGNLTVTNTVMP